MSAGYDRIKEEIEVVAGGIESTIDRALCPAPLIPNIETLAAMQELERGKGVRFASVQALMADLADDHETR